MDTENLISKLIQILDRDNEQLFRDLFVQASILLGEENWRLLPVVMAMDLPTNHWLFMWEHQEVNVFGHQGFLKTGDDDVCDDDEIVGFYFCRGGSMGGIDFGHDAEGSCFLMLGPTREVCDHEGEPLRTEQFLYQFPLLFDYDD